MPMKLKENARLRYRNKNLLLVSMWEEVLSSIESAVCMFARKREAGEVETGSEHVLGISSGD